ncbi:MAG TPA: acyltransferase [Ferruginibacter sp.]|nr:acyltransferase [Ferruginibacter sp.]
MITQQKNLHLIQLLRGVASILVVLMHLTVNFSEILNHSYLFGIFYFGGSGVDIFFVLSGFIITYSHLQHIGNPSATGTFLKKRFIRIYPIYFIIATVFLATQLALPAFYRTHFDTSIGNLLQTYFLLPEHVMINGVSWTLTNELFFYLLFTLALIIPDKKYTLYLALAYFIFLAALALTGTDIANGNKYTVLVFHPMNLEFLLGVLIVLIVKKIPKKITYPILVIGILWFISGAMLDNNKMIIVPDKVNPALNRVILSGISSFLIILALVKLEITSRIKINSLFLKLGDASYSIYLIHLPLVVAYCKIIAKFNIKSDFTLFALTSIFLIAVCWVGIMIYQRVEKPLISKLNKAWLSRSSHDRKSEATKNAG